MRELFDFKAVALIFMNMAAPSGARSSTTSSPPGFDGFPFPLSAKQSEDKGGKEQEQSGDIKKKPCRACTDFKSWMRVQKQTTATTQVT